jgi:hypothetical protein
MVSLLGGDPWSEHALDFETLTTPGACVDAIL